MQLEKQEVDGHVVSYSSDWTNKLEGKDHWILYWTQAYLVKKYVTGEHNIVELGVGTKFLSNYLRSREYNITTVDIDAGKKPDYVCDALSFDYSASSVNTVLAFEIFEHIPLSTFKKLIVKLKKSGVDSIIFSVPKCRRRLFTIQVRIPFVGNFKVEPRFWFWRIVTASHFWELGKRSKEMPEKKLLVSEIDFEQIFNMNNFSLKEVKREANIHFYVAKSKEA